MRRMFRFTWFVVIAACIYLGWNFYSRWSEKRTLIQRLEENKRSQDRDVLDLYGGDRLTILAFYATPPTIHQGESTQLCYGVSNSESVRIEPPVKNVWPSFSRCVEVTPKEDTVFRLIAEDAEGNTATAETTVKVQ
jgi:hypothetical protein